MRLASIIILISMFSTCLAAGKEVNEFAFLDESRFAEMTPAEQAVELAIISRGIDIKLSMLPPGIIDRLHEIDQRYLGEVPEKNTSSWILLGYPDGFRRAWAEGYTDAIIDLLYVVGILPSPENIRWNINNLNISSDKLTGSRLRKLVTVIFLLNYKEEKPVSPTELIINQVRK